MKIPPETKQKSKDLKLANELVTHFREWNLDPESFEYLRFHSRRYMYLLELVKKFLKNNTNKNIQLLDVGSSFQTELFRNSFPDITVNTLGFKDVRFNGRENEKHFEFDLNDAFYKEKWITPVEHDIIIMAEVIEHLYTSPVTVLEFISTFLKKEGILIIQTPNAVVLAHRLKMIKGINPFEKVRTTRTNPGHFREYTIDELTEFGDASGFKTTAYAIENYFVNDTKTQKFYDILDSVLPRQLCQGITIILQKK